MPAEQRCDYYGNEPIEETDECKGCMFNKRKPIVCTPVGLAAVAAGLPDCESRPHKCDPGYIYVPDPSDGRQLDLLVDLPQE